MKKSPLRTPSSIHSHKYASVGPKSVAQRRTNDLASTNSILKSRNKQLRDRIEEVIMERMGLESKLQESEKFEELYFTALSEKESLERELTDVLKQKLLSATSSGN
jgi:hypothetical protein